MLTPLLLKQELWATIDVLTKRRAFEVDEVILKFAM
jgi:hypothetical protein